MDTDASAGGTGMNRREATGWQMGQMIMPLLTGELEQKLRKREEVHDELKTHTERMGEDKTQDSEGQESSSPFSFTCKHTHTHSKSVRQRHALSLVQSFSLSSCAFCWSGCHSLFSCLVLCMAHKSGHEDRMPRVCRRTRLSHLSTHFLILLAAQPFRPSIPRSLSVPRTA